MCIIGCDHTLGSNSQLIATDAQLLCYGIAPPFFLMSLSNSSKLINVHLLSFPAAPVAKISIHSSKFKAPEEIFEQEGTFTYTHTCTHTHAHTHTHTHTHTILRTFHSGDNLIQSRFLAQLMCSTFL